MFSDMLLLLGAGKHLPRFVGALYIEPSDNTMTPIFDKMGMAEEGDAIIR
jgi:hypothetical protein